MTVIFRGLSSRCRRSRGWANLPANPKQDAVGRSDCGVAGLGSALGRGFGGDFAGGLLGPGNRQGGRSKWGPSHANEDSLRALGAGRCGSEGAGHGIRQVDGGFWEVADAWGEINRFQRLNGDIVQRFDDAQPSSPVGFTYSKWGSLASFAPAYTAAETAGRRERRSGMGPAGIVLSLWWSLGIRCGRGPSRRAGKADIRSRPTSRIRWSGTARGICARSTSIGTN